MVKTETKKITLQETAHTIFTAYGQVENIKKKKQRSLYADILFRSRPK